MNGMGNCGEDSAECPLCMEPFEVDDLNFYPCTCGYQICRFCWHRIRTDENELCPACRKAYPENPADFTPLSKRQITALKTEKRQRDQQRKQKITENRKHLANVRVMQKNLVFVVGLPPRLADPEILKKHEYFGKYGKIHKVVINPSTTYAGVQQGPSASAYVTYCSSNDGLRAIQSVNNIIIDSRLIKTSLGTTKYCSHFMKNQSCPKPDCMYLHELGDPEASFTKEEMHLGKHQEYEKRLHDQLIAATAEAVAAAAAFSANELAASEAASAARSEETSAHAASSAAVAANGGGSKDAWPSLSVSPVNNKELSIKVANGGKSNGKDSNSKKTKDRSKNKKQAAQAAAALAAAEKSASAKAVAASSIALANKSETEASATKLASTSRSSSSESSGEHSSARASTTSSSSTPDISTDTTSSTPDIGFDTESKVSAVDTPKSMMMGVDEELNLISEIENDALLGDELDEKLETPSPLGSSLSGGSRTVSESASGKSSPTAFHGNGHANHDGADNANLGHDQSTNHTNLVRSNSHLLLADSSFNGNGNAKGEQIDAELRQLGEQLAALRTATSHAGSGVVTTNSSSSSFLPPPGLSLSSGTGRGSAGLDQGSSGDSNSLTNGLMNNVIDTNSRYSKLDLFDDNNSFFSTNTFHQPYSKLEQQQQQQQQQFHGTSDTINTNSPQLPDLLNGTETNKERTSNGGGQQMHLQDSSDKLNLLKGLGDFGNTLQGYNANDNWEALKYALSKNKQHSQVNQLDMDDLLGMQHQQQHQQKRNIINGLGMPHFNGLQNDFSSNDLFNPPNDRFTQMMQQQQQLPPHHPQHPSQQQQQFNQHHPRHQQQNASAADSFSHVYAGNMSKFFDFHKNQQQQQQQTQQQQFMQNASGNGGQTQPPPHPDAMSMASLLDNSRMNSQFIDHTSNGLFGSTATAKQTLLNNTKFNHVGPQPPHQSYSSTQQPPQHLQHSRMQSHFAQQQPQTTTNAQQSSDDDLGFDPFFETQKGLAELLENEMIQLNQSKLLDNCQRTRMPPPGFNHMNAFGFGVPRAQGSKILPFMNASSGAPPQSQHNNMQQSVGTNNGWGQAPQQQQPQQQLQPPMQQQNMGYEQAPSHLHQSSKSGYGSMTDWTALDPAIVSFRQFPSFMPGSQPHPPHPQQQQLPQSHNSAALDMFMPHHQQQQQQQQQQQLPQGMFDNSNKMKSGIDYTGRSNSSAFGAGPHGLNLNNSIMNQQQQQQQQQQQSNPSAQVNFSHANWLNGIADQTNMFMNNLPNNGFGANGGPTNTNYDKFSIPMPPGFHNVGSKQQKAECIN